MNYASLIRPISIGLIVTVFHSPISLAQSCQRRAQIISGADVFALPPSFITGRGWRGKNQQYLERGTQVYICAERSIEFGLSTKVWVKIAYRGTAGFEFGWVARENVADWHTRGHYDGGKTYFGLIGVAYASEAPVEGTQQSKWMLGKPP